jgi:hypothetical protein
MDIRGTHWHAETYRGIHGHNTPKINIQDQRVKKKIQMQIYLFLSANSHATNSTVLFNK